MLRRGEELFQLSAGPAGPFGGEPARWYKGRSGGGPPWGLGVLVGFAGPAVAGALSSGLHGATRILVGLIGFAIPVLVVDLLWSERKRRQEELLFPRLEAE